MAENITKKSKLEIRFFKTSNGIEPVRKWLQDLTKEEKNNIGTDLKIVEFNWPIGRPLVKSLSEGLWEIRTNLPSNKICRIIFFMHKKQIILLHGFIKKTQKTPQKEIVLAKQRKRQFEEELLYENSI